MNHDCLRRKISFEEEGNGGECRSENGIIPFVGNNWLQLSVQIKGF
jgi:hypothetical protein